MNAQWFADGNYIGPEELPTLIRVSTTAPGMEREEVQRIARLVAAAPALLGALRIGLYHTQRAADWTHEAYRRALEQGMHGTADRHHQAWLDTLAAIKVIEAALEGQS